jgi:hypothetical protein
LLLDGEVADIAVMVDAVFKPAAEATRVYVSHGAFAITRCDQLSFLLVAYSTKGLISFGKLIHLFCGDFITNDRVMVSADYRFSM